MPKSGKEVYVTDIEVAILKIFMDRKILDDKTIADTLDVLTAKLRGNDAKAINGD